MAQTDKTMRILVLTNYYPPFEIGGWGQLTHDITTRLRQRNHQVMVLTSNYRATEPHPHDPQTLRQLHLESPDHIHYHPAYTLTWRQREKENRHILTRTVHQFQPDLIYINGMWNLPRSTAHHAEQLLPGRVAYYMASYWPIEPDAHTAYWSDHATTGWRRWPKQLVGHFVRRFWLDGTPRNQLDFPLVLCVSNYMRRIMIEQAGISPERVHVVYNGIDLEAFPPKTSYTPHQPLRLLYAGRIDPSKGVHTVLEGLSILRTRAPQLSVTLSLVGSGTPAYEAFLRNQAETLGVADMLIWRGRVPREQMPQVLTGHDVLLFPSVWAEPLARMVQEAMACGLVVIGTTTGGTPEILREDENGLTFAPEDAVMLATQIARVASDSALCVRLAQAARQTVAARFTLPRMVDELEMYFAELITQRELAYAFG
ncbi:MAG: glycosyltransferase family 1 protein [Chloroflexi bacterium]|nr:MAG: glycosyltransferase family 1 protein [Chloroflexota bacterium]